MTIQPRNFKKKPVTIQAAQFNHGEHTKAEWLEYVPDANIGVRVTDPENDPEGLQGTEFSWFLIPTLEGDHSVTDGDWIITGVEGEHYPCKRAIFDKTYDQVEGRENNLIINAVRDIKAKQG